MSFCDIIQSMRKRNIFVLPLISCLVAGTALADWQYPGTYVGDGWYEDDGTRFVISLRGGASYGIGGIKNDAGAIANEYFISPDGGTVVSATYYYSCVDQGGCEDYLYAGYGELNKLSPSKDLQTFSFAAGFSVGWTLPNKPQWRIEGGFDTIDKSEYNASPLFEGKLNLVGGDVSDVSINAQSATVNSELETEVYSIMAFYDFFDGVQKPVRTFIPYVGFGFGYADTTTTLNLSDPYGDLSSQVELQQYGEVDEFGVVQFFKSERRTSNIAGLLALGFSYGITETMFMDFGARITYLPRVKWELTNEDESRQRDWFSAENLIYANVMLGLRFEF